MSTETTTVKVIQVSMPQPLLEAVTHYAKARMVFSEEEREQGRQRMGSG